MNASIPDPLIDEVRQLRRDACGSVGNDVDRLGDELERIEKDYRERSGRFANVPRTATQDLFPDAARLPPDPLNEELRSIRKP